MQSQMLWMPTSKRRSFTPGPKNRANLGLFPISPVAAQALIAPYWRARPPLASNTSAKAGRKTVQDYDDDYREQSWTRDERYHPDEEPRRGWPWRKILIGLGAAAGVMVAGVAVFLFLALQGLPSLEQ